MFRSLAVVLPLAAYALCDHAARDRVYGWAAAFDKTVLECTVVVATVYLLLMRLSQAAIRRRAVEVGLDVPGPIRLRDRRWTLASGAVIALASAACTRRPTSPSAGRSAAAWCRSWRRRRSSSASPADGPWPTQSGRPCSG